MQLPLVWTSERSTGSKLQQPRQPIIPDTVKLCLLRRRHSSPVSAVPDNRRLNTHLTEALKVLGTIKMTVGISTSLGYNIPSTVWAPFPFPHLIWPAQLAGGTPACVVLGSDLTDTSRVLPTSAENLHQHGPVSM